nr:cupin domain-containing protein [Allomuricauda sp.]
MKEVEELIQRFGLQPHPEGGFFKETYRSEGEILESSLSEDYEGERNYSTCIYFLLTSDTFSAFHKINQDEIWHFYSGGPLRIHSISEEGAYTSYELGNDFQSGFVPQAIVPGGNWFAAETLDPDSYSFVGCTVAPGFDFEDFVLPSQKELLEKFPIHEQLIRRLTRI